MKKQLIYLLLTVNEKMYVQMLGLVAGKVRNSIN